ncbi:hypothetical protein NIES23_61600 (plasmid) [Trichormus variabilis NIES-23]|uniref:Uncharacterized protein n=1 Tax=Trichormus variabilis NIES-23 TaxID=1973479 RepID=A0A1Z4KWS0_ANAVA|nr:hypothetical protein NIES23_61600 [Trichormus variabilis NIES-23]
MEQNQQVILSVKRTTDTQEGRLLSYLQKEPFDLGTLPEIVMLTLKQYWSPFAMSVDGADGEQLRQRAIWAIGQLEAQAALIRAVFLEPSVVQTQTITNPVQTQVQAQAQQINGVVESSPSQTQTQEAQDLEPSDDDEPEWMDIKLSEEMKKMNKLFGVE